MTPRSTDWLVKVAREAGRLTSARAPALDGLDLAQAWQAVARACGATTAELAAMVARHHGLPVADLRHVERSAMARLPDRVTADRWIVAVRETQDGLEVATADPSDAEATRLLQFALDTPVVPSIAAPDAIASVRQSAGEGDATLLDTASGSGAGDVMVIDDGGLPVPAMVRLSDQMLREAVDRGASDIHIQPLDNDGVIRMRIDGVLRNVAALPRPVMLRLASRVKLMATMDPTDTIRPQDGRLRISYRGRLRDLRVSSVPANGAEKLVLRLLGGESRTTLADVGLTEPELGQLGALLQRAQGLVLVTGPTGSGKTTTLYSALAERNDEGVNIATVEDPVEIRLRWLTQIEVNPKAELTFANALRSVLRQDPDIILIGEIRDSETAQIAVQASITGHLVLATLHTHDALGALPRLIDLGVSRQLLAEALGGASAQRLVRRLCPDCRAEDTRDDEGAQWLRTHGGVPRLWRPVGCPACAQTGYRGRLPVAQVFALTPEMAVLLEEGAPVERLREVARRQGMRSLGHSAADHLREGRTGLDEVLRILGQHFWLDLGTTARTPAPPVVRPAPATPPDRAAGPPVLVVGRDDGLRQLAAQALQDAGHAVALAGNALEARQVIERVGAVRAILMDLTGLRPERVEALLGLRDRLGAAAIPILGMRLPQDESIDALLEQHPNVIVRDKPADMADVEALLAEAIASLG